MASTKSRRAADYITPLNMNGLYGRMLRMPAPAGKKREILFIYGHHSSLERWWGVMQDLNRYGAVTMPDLPGFGGMDSLYKIGQRPTLDAMADYLAAFVKMQYSRRCVTIVGMSFGFVVATKMLQRYPDLSKKVEMVISAAGFTHHDDLTISKGRYFGYMTLASVFSHKIPAIFFKNVILHPSLIRAVYRHTHNAKHKFNGLTQAQLKKMLDVEVELWHCNDVRTYMATSKTILTVNICDKPVHVPLWHIAVNADQYFDNHLVEQHMRVVYDQYNRVDSALDKHAPSVISSIEESEPLIPDEVRQVLAAA